MRTGEILIDIFKNLLQALPNEPDNSGGVVANGPLAFTF